MLFSPVKRLFVQYRFLFYQTRFPLTSAILADTTGGSLSEKAGEPADEFKNNRGCLCINTREALCG
jgi:hypothetical protein